MTIPARTPDNEIIWPEDEGFYTSLELTGSLSLTGTAWVTADSALEADAAKTTHLTRITSGLPVSYATAEVVAELTLDAPEGGGFAAASVAFICHTAASEFATIYHIETGAYLDDEIVRRYVRLYMSGAEDLIVAHETPIPPANRAHMSLMPGGITIGWDGEDKFNYSYPVSTVDGTPYAPTSIGVREITLPTAGGWETRLTAARFWISDADAPPEPTIAGMWGIRQRQTLAGNTGGHAIRQRQNGGANGGHPVRQRQIGN